MRDTARAQRGRPLMWDIWNEPDVRDFWRGGRRRLIRTYVVAARALREELGPGVVIGGPSISRYSPRLPARPARRMRARALPSVLRLVAREPAGRPADRRGGGSAGSGALGAAGRSALPPYRAARDLRDRVRGPGGSLLPWRDGGPPGRARARRRRSGGPLVLGAGGLHAGRSGRAGGQRERQAPRRLVAACVVRPGRRGAGAQPVGRPLDHRARTRRYQGASRSCSATRLREDPARPVRASYGWPSKLEGLERVLRTPRRTRITVERVPRPASGGSMGPTARAEVP